MNWKSTAAVSGATVLATWLGSTPAREPAVARAPVAPRDTRPQAVSDIETEARRLQGRLRGDLEFHAPARNPFRFAARPSAVVQPHQALPVAPTYPLPFAELRPYTVAGIATDVVDGQTNRTAIVSTASDVLFVHAGDALGNYRVTRIDDDGIQVTGPEGTVRVEITRP